MEGFQLFEMRMAPASKGSRGAGCRAKDPKAYLLFPKAVFVGALQLPPSHAMEGRAHRLVLLDPAFKAG